MPVREFLRGGYRTLKEPTVISSHGHPLFTVIPTRRRVNPLRPDAWDILKDVDKGLSEDGYR